MTKIKTKKRLELPKFAVILIFSLYNISKKLLHRISGSQFYEWLFRPEKFSGLLRNGPLYLYSITHMLKLNLAKAYLLSVNTLPVFSSSPEKTATTQTSIQTGKNKVQNFICKAQKNRIPSFTKKENFQENLLL